MPQKYTQWTQWTKWTNTFEMLTTQKHFPVFSQLGLTVLKKLDQNRPKWSNDKLVLLAIKVGEICAYSTVCVCVPHPSHSNTHSSRLSLTGESQQRHHLEEVCVRAQSEAMSSRRSRRVASVVRGAEGLDVLLEVRCVGVSPSVSPLAVNQPH